MVGRVCLNHFLRSGFVRIVWFYLRTHRTNWEKGSLMARVDGYVTHAVGVPVQPLHDARRLVVKVRQDFLSGMNDGSRFLEGVVPAYFFQSYDFNWQVPVGALPSLGRNHRRPDKNTGTLTRWLARDFHVEQSLKIFSKA